MQSSGLLKDASRVSWLAAVVAMGIMGWTPLAEAQAASQIPAERRGVVVEEVGEESALEKAGLQVGDVVLAWERLPAPPANPEGAQGTIDSVFDWIGLQVEQAPRGTLKLTGQRGGEVKVFEVKPGSWKATLRPGMPEEMLEDYSKGKELIEAEEPEAGIDLWHKVAGVAENQTADGHLKCWLLLRIGDAWRQARQWERAHDAYRLALVAAPDPLARVAIWQAIGDAYEKASEFEAAREAYGSAQEIRERAWGESLALARGLNDLARLDWKQGRLDSFQSYSRRALEIRQKLAPESLAVAGSLHNLGLVAYHRGDLARAVEYYEGALEIKQKLAPESLAVAASLHNLGLVAQIRSDPARAVEYYEGALEIKQMLAPDSLTVASSLHNLGNVASDRGDLARAVEYYEGALEIRQKLAPDSLTVAASLSTQGNVARGRGDLARAVEYHERALKIQQKLVPESLNVSNSLNNLGIVAKDRGDLARAVEYYKGALEIQQKLAPDSLVVARSLNNLGNVAKDRSDLARAVEYYEGALEIKQKLAPDSLDVASSLHNLGNVATDRGDLARAVEYHEGALEIKQKLAPDSLIVSKSLQNLGNAAKTRGDLARAVEYYEGALEIRRKLAPGSSDEARVLRALATVRRKQNQPQPALALFRQALKALESQVSRLGGSRDVQAGFRAQWADYYRDTLDLELELHQAEEAFHTLERSRGQSFLAQLAERDLVFSNVSEELERQRRHIAHSYDQTQDEIAQLHPREQAEEIQALLDHLQQLRWERDDLSEKIITVSPKLGALRYPQPLELDVARQALDPGTVMLSYSVGANETRLFVLTREEELRVETLPFGEEELRGEVEKILELQRTRSAAPYKVPLRQAGERLYQVLVQPAEEWITQSDRVLIVPDEPLHLLPFALLVRKTGPGEGHGDRDFEYLVEWKPVHSVLSATVYAELKGQRRDPTVDDPAGLALAAFGDPLYTSPESDDPAADRGVDVYVRAAAERGFDFRPLPYSREEVSRIAGLYPEGDAQTFLGAGASEERAKSVGKSARILHFATHGRFDDRFPLNSYLALTLPEEFRKDQDNGLLQVWEIFEDVRLDADLVVLSACESGLGDELDGEGLIGLTRAFQFAGARTVASSLWQVDDRATAELMQRFYRHLRAGTSKDQALRAAQLELIQRPVAMKNRQGRVVERDLSLPYYWAAFQIIGDWR